MNFLGVYFCVMKLIFLDNKLLEKLYWLIKTQKKTTLEIS